MQNFGIRVGCWAFLFVHDNKDHDQAKEYLEKKSIPELAAILQVDVVHIKREERELSVKCTGGVQVELVNTETPLDLVVSYHDCLDHGW